MISHYIVQCSIFIPRKYNHFSRKPLNDTAVLSYLGRNLRLHVVGLLHLHPFMNSHFHFLTVVKQPTFKVFLQWHKQLSKWSKSSQRNNCNNSCAGYVLCGVALLWWKITPCYMNILDCWSHTWRISDSKIMWKWKWLFVNRCKWMCLISPAKELLVPW